MKIEDTSKAFQPIIITIETQEEADVLAAAIARLSGDDPGGNLYKLYCALSRKGSEYEGVGTLRIQRKV